MRVIQTSEITNAVSELCIRANCVMNEGLLNALHEARDSEELPVAKGDARLHARKRRHCR